MWTRASVCALQPCAVHHQPPPCGCAGSCGQWTVDAPDMTAPPEPPPEHPAVPPLTNNGTCVCVTSQAQYHRTGHCCTARALAHHPLAGRLRTSAARPQGRGLNLVDFLFQRARMQHAMVPNLVHQLKVLCYTIFYKHRRVCEYIEAVAAIVVVVSSARSASLPWRTCLSVRPASRLAAWLFLSVHLQHMQPLRGPVRRCLRS